MQCVTFIKPDDKDKYCRLKVWVPKYAPKTSLHHCIRLMYVNLLKFLFLLLAAKKA